MTIKLSNVKALFNFQSNVHHRVITIIDIKDGGGSILFPYSECETGHGLGQNEGAKYKPEESLLQFARNLRLDQVLKWPSESLDLNLNKALSHGFPKRMGKNIKIKV